jgi:hypothetical protein
MDSSYGSAQGSSYCSDAHRARWTEGPATVVVSAAVTAVVPVALAPALQVDFRRRRRGRSSRIQQ